MRRAACRFVILPRWANLGRMTDATISGVPLVGRPIRAKTKDVPLPKPQPFGAPVFITDCASPLAGETVLSLLMKRLACNDNV